MLPERHDTESYAHQRENAFFTVKDQPLSTFSADVDTASYANIRRFLSEGRLPPAGAVRIEEMLNYFRYAYPEAPADAPFSVTSEVGVCPWNTAHRLVLLGLRGKDIADRMLPPRNLTFLLDVSGSMNSPDKLPLVQSAMKMLARTMRAQDRIAIVAYAGASGLVLAPTSGTDVGRVLAAIDELRAGGSTNGASGIRLAYQVAREHFHREGINRVILATDGDFNVGTTSESELVRLIEEERKTGVFLTVLGVGRGNLKDSTMEKLADCGNGNYAYLDSVAEARKVLVTQAGGTLVTIAKDVKLQVEFNPARVQGYRLIGYENRVLQAQDFKDDRKDAGELGAGHTVTALYEIVPVGAPAPAGSVDPLKYQEKQGLSSAALSGELLTLKLRYKEPDADTSKELATVVQDVDPRSAIASANLRLASALATFGMVLRGSEHKGTASYALAKELLAQGNEAVPPEQQELVELIARAAGMMQATAVTTK